MKRKLKCTPTRTIYPTLPFLPHSFSHSSVGPSERALAFVRLRSPARAPDALRLAQCLALLPCVRVCVCRLRCLTLKNEQVQSHSCSASGSDANIDVDCKAGNDFRPRRKMKFTKIFRRLCFCCCCCCRRKMFCSSNSAACL